MKTFSWPFVVGCGGTEEPFLFGGKKYLYCFNMHDKKHYYYSFSDDMFYADNDVVNLPFIK